MPKTKTYVCEIRDFMRVTWYLGEEGKLMAQNSVIRDRMTTSGETPPGFNRFVGNGKTTVDTIAGPQEVAYSIPIPGAKDIDDAFKKLQAADALIEPEVQTGVKSDIMAQFKAETSRLALPGEGPMLPGGPVGLAPR